MVPHNIAIAELGQRTRNRAVEAIHNKGGLWRLVAACDANDAAREAFAPLHPNVLIFEDVLHLVQWRHEVMATRYDYADVAVPRHLHSEIVVPLLEASIHVLKDKPPASTPEELDIFQSPRSSDASSSHNR